MNFALIRKSEADGFCQNGLCYDLNKICATMTPLCLLLSIIHSSKHGQTFKQWLPRFLKCQLLKQQAQAVSSKYELFVSLSRQVKFRHIFILWLQVYLLFISCNDNIWVIWQDAQVQDVIFGITMNNLFMF